MHFATVVHHVTKGRNKSVHFERSLMSLDSTEAASTRGTSTPPLVPGNRINSLPLHDMKENTSTTIRHYRSMLDVEPAPKLPLTQPLSYDELYPRAAAHDMAIVPGKPVAACQENHQPRAVAVTSATCAGGSWTSANWLVLRSEWCSGSLQNGACAPNRDPQVFSATLQEHMH